MPENNCTQHEHGPKQISEGQLRELRGQYFTVRHERVKTCGHALDSINEPTFRNCETCWFSFFITHGELVKVTDEAIQEHGLAFVDKLRGKKYRVQFCRFMSTMNRLREDAEKLKETNGQSSEIQSNRDSRENSGQTVRNNDLPTTGESSQ